jgi:hypothetical protein
MKKATQTFGLILVYLFWLSVSPARAHSLTLGASTGHTGDHVTVTGTGFLANTSGFVFFDQSYNYLWDSSFCGKLHDQPCEPYVAVTTDSVGNFVTDLIIPPGYYADFLGAGSYLVIAQILEQGWTPFQVPSYTTFTRSTSSNTKYVWLSSSLYVPYFVKLAPSQSHGIAWIDTNGDFNWNEGEPYTTVFVNPDGYLSSCAYSPCGVSIIDTTGITTTGLFVRVHIGMEGDSNRSAAQKVEASVYLPPLCSRGICSPLR